MEILDFHFAKIDKFQKSVQIKKQKDKLQNEVHSNKNCIKF